MWLPPLKTLFIHVPKTAGNFVQSFLIENGLSDDEITTVEHQDGHDRFGVLGKMTGHKHQDVRGYQKKFGRKAWSELEVLSIWRDPRERLVSLYLSPHRHVKANGKIVPPRTYDESGFEELVNNTKSTTQFLETRRGNLPKSLNLITFSNLHGDLERFLISKGHDLIIPQEKRNETASRQLFGEMLADKQILKIVERSHHMADFKLPSL